MPAWLYWAINMGLFDRFKSGTTATQEASAAAWAQKGAELNKRDRHQEAIPCFDEALERLQLISRRQFAITRFEARSYIEDLGSTNGTTVNGRAIQGMGKVALADRDRIEIPNVVSVTYVETIMEEQ